MAPSSSVQRLPFEVSKGPGYESIGVHVNHGNLPDANPMNGVGGVWQSWLAARRRPVVVGVLASVVVSTGCLLFTSPASVEPAAAEEAGVNPPYPNYEAISPVPLTHVVTLEGDAWKVMEMNPYELNARAEFGGLDLAASGLYTDADRHASNFGELHIKTEPSDAYTPAQRAYAAGVLEGYLTHERMLQSARNIACEVSCEEPVPQNILDFFEAQDEWKEAKIAKHYDEETDEGESFFKSISMIRAQFEGVLEGSRQAAAAAQEEQGVGAGLMGAVKSEPADPETIDEPEIDVTTPLTRWQLQMLNAMGDLFDIKPALLHTQRADFSKMTPTEASQHLDRSGHCTALVTVSEDFSELLFGHSTWFHFSYMNRIYKHYDTDFGDDVPNSKMSFSSYPGMLSSFDDFYMMGDTQIAVIQTTNGIYNTSLYDLVVPENLYAWERIRAANMLATNGKEWSEVYARHNSGTYNNQYMVIDLKLFKPKEALLPNTLWVVEQIPGFVEAADATGILSLGYFPSFNVPFFPEIYARSGYPSLDARKGRQVGSEYQIAPRAMILRRDHGAAKNIDGLKQLLRANGYQKDPSKAEAEAEKQQLRHEISDIGHGFGFGSGVGLEPSAEMGMFVGWSDPLATDPWAAICSRGDLNPGKESLEGCNDSKGSSASLFKDGLKAWVVNGPTNDNQPTFSWEEVRVVPDNATGGPGHTSGASNAAEAHNLGMARHLGQPTVFDFKYEMMSPRWD